MDNALDIETPRLLLRPCTLDDVDDLHRLWTDPDVRRFLWDNRVISREQALEQVRISIASFAAKRFGIWLAHPRGAAAFAGFCGLRGTDDPRLAEVLYGFWPAYWGRGLATEALRGVLRYGFATCGLERIVGKTDVPNVASARVMDRAGMKFQAWERRHGLALSVYAIDKDASLAGNP